MLCGVLVSHHWVERTSGTLFLKTSREPPSLSSPEYFLRMANEGTRYLLRLVRPPKAARSK